MIDMNALSNINDSQNWTIDAIHGRYPSANRAGALFVVQ